MGQVVERARLDQGQGRRPPGHRLQGGGEPDHRSLLLGQPRPLLDAKRLDQPDAGLSRSDIGLGGLDAGGESSGRGPGQRGFAGRLGSLLLEQHRAPSRLFGLVPCDDEGVGLAGAALRRRPASA